MIETLLAYVTYIELPQVHFTKELLFGPLTKSCLLLARLLIFDLTSTTNTMSCSPWTIWPRAFYDLYIILLSICCVAMAAVGAARPGGGKLCLVQNNYLQSFSHSISSIEKNLEQIEWWYSIFKNNIG